MYKIDDNKRFTVRVRQPSRSEGPPIVFEHAELISISAGFVAFKDKKGKDHIFTGGAFSIQMSEE